MEVGIEAPGGELRGRWREPSDPEPTAVLLAHGAGAGQDHPGITQLADALAGHGFPVLTFNYPYMEAGRRFPDRQPTLLAAHRAAAAWLAQRSERMVMAGRSMGGRMASYLVADGLACRGLVMFAYPLHPASKPDSLRVGHLDSISVPILFFTGSKDKLALPHLVEQYLVPLPRATVEIVADADHSFRVPKRTGLTGSEVLESLAARTSRWIKALPTS